MTNLERLQLETKGIILLPTELSIYLAESGLTDTDGYDPQSNSNKRKIYSAALAILNSVANNPTHEELQRGRYFRFRFCRIASKPHRPVRTSNSHDVGIR
ncbi:hypothetical protein [Paenibacillus sp. J5C2022]|uniref:hypothetical protein n=1 Tax=Paenibacillus sp. J5C2022 TaxID=2977129 RepID=UPI00293E3DD8|nr:hypothetical protein [Paenibacillus sp. J5C2022]